jgi:DNA-binding transcriptional LysR family regulator
MLNDIDLSRTDLNLLALFEVVYERRHVGDAAKQLNLSPSAISHGLGRLRRLFNDPLFLRTPKGVVPTARAVELAGPIADVLDQTRRILATADPFDPATSTRRFRIGAPDGISAVILPALLADLAQSAPSVDLSVSQLLPTQGGTGVNRAWQPILGDLDSRAIDLAIAPLEEIPKRFAETVVFEDDFVIAVRHGHPFAKTPTLRGYCAARHAVVSITGDPHGFVDDFLAEIGETRRVAVTAPNFMMALALVADGDLLAAVPRGFAAQQARSFGIVSVDAPFAMPTFAIRAITPRVALMDAGLAWLFERVVAAAREGGRASIPQ